MPRSQFRRGRGGRTVLPFTNKTRPALWRKENSSHRHGGPGTYSISPRLVPLTYISFIEKKTIFIFGKLGPGRAEEVTEVDLRSFGLRVPPRHCGIGLWAPSADRADQ